MEPSCPHGAPPESAVLRVVLTSTIGQADEARLAARAALRQRLGLLDPAEEEASPDGPSRGQRSRRRRLLQSVPSQAAPLRSARIVVAWLPSVVCSEDHGSMGSDPSRKTSSKSVCSRPGPASTVAAA